MYEAFDHDTILKAALAEISDDVIKTEGSFLYAALSAFAYEVEKLYIQADYIISQSNASTADYDSLVLICADRGIIPEDATNAYVKISCNCTVPIGTRFSMKSYTYIITEIMDASSFTYKAKCEEAGAGPNSMIGSLTVIDYVEGLTAGTITEVLVEGEDAETKTELLARYLDSFTSSSFSGNISAYKKEINAIDGVGGCKIYPVWNGAGTVKAVVMSSGHGAISSYLVNSIQEAADPSKSGNGYGFAPIDHVVTIESVEEISVDVVTTISFSSFGYSWDTIGTEITSAISDYLKSIAAVWPEGDRDTTPIVYVSKLESAVLDVAGVTDITGTTLNTAGNNLILTSTQIPVLGKVTVS